MSSITAVANNTATENGTLQEWPLGTSVCPLCGGGKVSEFLVAPDRFHRRHTMYTLMTCSTCTFVWLANPPKPEEMGMHYDSDYHKSVTLAGEKDAASRWKAERKIVTSRFQGGSILDIGCSSGGFLSTMKGPNWKLYGIEIETSTAERARKNTGAEVYVGDAMEAPFAPESFDVITTFDVLEHMYNPREFLLKIKGWLKPGGIYYARVPNIASFESRVLGGHWYGLELPRHISHFSPKTLSALMASLDFAEVKVFTPSAAYIEYSYYYLQTTALAKLGITEKGPESGRELSFPLRVIRKALRMSVVAPFAWMQSAAGVSPSLEGVFSKKLR